MPLIGLISDTHNFLDPQVPGIFAGVAHILHAGDVGRPELLQELSRIAPVTAIAGNMDGALGLPQTAVVEVQDIRFLLCHILDPYHLPATLRQRVDREKPRAVVFGHTHRPFCETMNGIVYVNPGSAGKRRFHTPRSVAVLQSEEQGLDVRFHTLEQ